MTYSATLQMGRVKSDAGSCGADETSCEGCKVRERALFGAVSPKKVTWIQQFRDKQCTFSAGDVLCLENEKIEYAFTLHTGCLILYNNLVNGSRQILQVALPGDFIGLQRDNKGAITHTIQAVTDVRVCAFANKTMARMVREQTAIAEKLIDLQAYNLMLYQQQLLNLGQKTARERLAYLIMELYTRIRIQMPERFDMNTKESFFPLTQSDMGDATGLTKVHVNRVMMAFKSEKLILTGHRKMIVLNPRRLAEIGQFDISLIESPFGNFSL